MRVTAALKITHAIFEKTGSRDLTFSLNISPCILKARSRGCLLKSSSTASAGNVKDDKLLFLQIKFYKLVTRLEHSPFIKDFCF